MRRKDDLRPAQHLLIDAIYESDEQMNIAGMGAGKTAAALTAFAEMKADGIVSKLLVVAPPLVADTVWSAEVAKWEHLQHLRVATLTGSPKQRERLLSSPDDWDIATVSNRLCQWLREQSPKVFDMIIVDETSAFKNPRSKNGKALRKLMPSIPHRYGLTGTPRPNSYEDLWGQYQILTADRMWEPFDRWRDRLFKPLDYHGYRWGLLPGADKEIDANVTPMTTVIPPQDLGLEPLTTGGDLDIEVDLPEEARDAYDEMQKEFLLSLPDDAGEEAVIAALTSGVLSGKLSQIAQGFLYADDKGENVATIHNEKQEALAGLFEQCQEPVIIWYGFRQDIEAINAAWPGSKRLPVIGAGTAPSKKKAYIEEFSRGGIDAMIMHPASAAHGVDGLQHGGRIHIWYCPTWSPEQYEQALARLYRPGQSSPVLSYRILAKGTVDLLKVARVEGRIEESEEWRALMQAARG